MRRPCIRAARIIAACCALAITTAPVAAQVRCDLLQRFSDRIDRTCDDSLDGDCCDLTIPDDFEPWWEAPGREPIRDAQRARAIDPLELAAMALRSSPKVRGLRNARLAAYADLDERQAVFDWRFIAESEVVRQSRPTGSILDTGGPLRFRDVDWANSLGLQRATGLGGQFEARQEFGYYDSNSSFLDPRRHGDTRMTLRYRQPLLNGGGQLYAHQYILIASSEASAASADFLDETQDLLVKITDLYWSLYRARVVLLQKERNYETGRATLERLENRQGLDTRAIQLIEAKAAVARRRTALVDARLQVRNLETRIRSTVAAPELWAAVCSEMVPLQPPVERHAPTDLKATLQRALRHRPEIQRALDEIDTAEIRQGVAGNELRPTLDLLMEMNIDGLRGEFDLGRSFVDQFSQGEPSYTVGLTLDVPLGNRAARAAFRRRQLELEQKVCHLVQTVDDVLADAEIAVRRSDAAYQETLCAYHAMIDRQREVAGLTARWELLAGDEEIGSVLLEQLLTSQERLMAAEADFVDARVRYSQSLTEIQRAEGTLLSFRRDDADRCATPVLNLGPAAQSSAPTVAPTESNMPLLRPAPLPPSSGPVTTRPLPPPPLGPTTSRAAAPPQWPYNPSNRVDGVYWR